MIYEEQKNPQEAHNTPERLEGEDIGSEIVSEAEELTPAAFEQSFNELTAESENSFSKGQERLSTIVATEVTDPKVKEEIEALKEEAQHLQEATLQKIGEQLGSNRGGWYEARDTGERYYAKFYENPDQSRAEFIANAIYEKLGIKAARSELSEIDGEFAVLSGEIPEAQRTYLDQQQENFDVQSGFVADAYLANWDVVGLIYDNIVQGKDGMYRIDNGGSLMFRARGGPKEFGPDSIPELETMLNLDFPAGRVFKGMSEAEMEVQARHLIENLEEEDIDAIIAESGLKGDVREQVLTSLKGRRQFLVNRFGPEQDRGQGERKDRLGRIPVALERFGEQMEQLQDMEIRPRVSLLVDSDKIENQQIDIIDASDEGLYKVNFKLTAEHYNRILLLPRVLQAEFGEISYSNRRGKEYGSVLMAQSYDIKMDGITIKISMGQNRDGRQIRSALGLVQIEIPQEELNLTPEEIEDKLQEIFVEVLEIPEGLSAPDAEAERQYKRARYEWHHKHAAPEGIESSLSRKEVAPDYYTMIEKGKHEEYEALSPYGIFHRVLGSIPTMLKAGGLLSTHERYRRGLILGGQSSSMDLVHGGADSVFTRIVTEEGLKTKTGKGVAESTSFTWLNGNDVFLVFDADLLDRTDWYAYTSDKYGTTEQDTFETRQSPQQLFDDQKEGGYYRGNEQMFRTGISIEKIKAIVCTDKLIHKDTLEEIKDAGITQINGIPVEEFVVIADNLGAFIDISQGKQPRSRGELDESLAA